MTPEEEAWINSLEFGLSDPDSQTCSMGEWIEMVSDNENELLAVVILGRSYTPEEAVKHFEGFRFTISEEDCE